MSRTALAALAALAVLVAAGACEGKGKKAEDWQTDTPPSTGETTPPEDELVDLYGDRLPAGSVTRLGSVRMLDRALGRAIFSADGSEIITSSEESYLVWQTTTAQRVGTLTVGDAAPAMAISSGGKHLATALYDGGIALWDYPARKAVSRLNGHRRVVNRLCFVGETKLVSGAEDRSLRVWNISGGDPQVLSGDWDRVVALACTPSGTIIFGDNRGSVWLGDVSKDKAAPPIRLAFGDKVQDAGVAVTAVAIRADRAHVAAGLADGSIALWKVSEPKSPKRFDAHKRTTLSVAFMPDGALYSSGGDATFRLWDAETGEKTGERPAAADVDAQLFELSPDGSFVVAYSELRGGRASEAGRFWLYDGSGDQLLEPDRHTEAITAVAFMEDDTKVLTASEDSTVRRWNVADGVLERVVSNHKAAVHAIAFDSGGKLLSVGADARMHLSNPGGTGDSIILEPLGGDIRAMARFPDGGRLLIGDFAGKVWSLGRKSGLKQVRHDSEAFSTIHELAFAPDGKLFAIAGANRHVHIVSAATGKKLLMLSPPDVVANFAVAFSPNGKLIATGGDDHLIRLWSTASFKQVGALKGHDGTIRAVAFSPDGSRLASGSSDETARLWRIKDRSEITLLAGHRGAVSAVAFASNGAMLATGSRDKTTLLWKLPKSETPKPAPATKPAQPEPKPAPVPEAKGADPAPKPEAKSAEPEPKPEAKGAEPEAKSAEPADKSSADGGGS